MKLRSLGSSDISVSELCLGTMYFGTKVHKTHSFQVLDQFVDSGGNFIDTANNYSWWIGGTGDESEELIGEWMHLRNNRDQIVLASKFGARPIDPRAESPIYEELTKESIFKSVESSLRRLGTDYLDLSYIHADFKQYPLEERMEALFLLEKQGKIRFKGCSNISSARVVGSEFINSKNDWPSFQAIQQKFSYLLPNVIDENAPLKFLDDSMLDFAEENNVSVLTYSVLLSGAYNKGYDSLPKEYDSSLNKVKFESIVQASKEIGCTPSQYVLLWTKQQSKQIIPLVAASNTNQLTENINALQFKFNG